MPLVEKASTFSALEEPLPLTQLDARGESYGEKQLTIAILLAAAALAQNSASATPVSSNLNDYNLSLDGVEQVMVFARSEAEFRNARILIAERSGAGWSAPVPISFTDDRYADSDPWLTPDGKTLYFISDRPAEEREQGRTDYDIWQSNRTADGWSPPEHLGREVNSRGQELAPELHDGALFFSSARKNGVGGLDIYRAEVVGGRLQPAELVEGPFNTISSESDFTLSSDGQSALFWRSLDGRGTIHISYRDLDRWSDPVPLAAPINSGPFNFTPSFSADGRQIRYASTVEREGQENGLADIFESQLPDRRDTPAGAGPQPASSTSPIN